MQRPEARFPYVKRLRDEVVALVPQRFVRSARAA